MLKAYGASGRLANAVALPLIAWLLGACSNTVEPKACKPEFQVDAPDRTVGTGTSIFFRVVHPLDIDCEYLRYYWQSSNPSVASVVYDEVDGGARADGLKPGLVALTVTAFGPSSQYGGDDGSSEKDFEIRVFLKLGSLELAADQSTLFVGQ